MDRTKKVAFAKALKEKRLRQARRSFKQFVIATKQDFELNWHHELMFSKLQDFADGKIQNLAIEAPPRHSKTESCSRRFPAYLLGTDPNLNIILGSYADALASAINRDVQRIIDEPKYAEIFPDTRLNSANFRSNAQGSYLRNADQFEIVGHTGGLKSVGVGAGVAGFGADVLLLDDALKNRQQARSEVVRNTVWDWVVNDLMTRLQGRKQILVVMTRWHEGDPIGLIKEKQKDPNFPRFEFLTLQAEKTEDIGHPEDPREVGEPLWPSRYGKDFLAERKAALLSDYDSLYQQDPSPSEGGRIKKDWLKYYTELPKPSAFSSYILSCDLTFDDTDGSDFTCLSVYGKAGTKIYLIDRVHERMNVLDQIRNIRMLLDQYPEVTGTLIEKAANGAATLSMLEDEVMGLIPVKPSKSKVDRLDAVLPMYAAGNVVYPDPSLAPWVNHHVKQMLMFPNGKHDDALDAETQALKYFSGDMLDRLEVLSQF